MKKRFSAVTQGDSRMEYAVRYLESRGFERTDNSEAAFLLLGVNPEKTLLKASVPVFAGNVSGDGVYDYTKQEAFATENAYLTAEGALSLAVSESRQSLINADVLIIGYGRIAKALQRYLTAFTGNITVCARRPEAAALATATGAKVINFSQLKNCNEFTFIFNTVPHPVMGEQELKNVKEDALLMELASFPGGIDRHFAAYRKLKLVLAGGLPARFSPQCAGYAVGKAVETMVKEVMA